MHNRNPDAAGNTGVDPVYVGCQGMLFDGQAYMTTAPIELGLTNSFTVEMQFKPSRSDQTSTIFAVENDALAF